VILTIALEELDGDFILREVGIVLFIECSSSSTPNGQFLNCAIVALSERYGVAWD
jgi:hypothetical protein